MSFKKPAELFQNYYCAVGTDIDNYALCPKIHEHPLDRWKSAGGVRHQTITKVSRIPALGPWVCVHLID